MNKPIATVVATGLAALILSSPAAAQEAGDAYVRVGASRTKLVDKGEIRVGGTLDPNAGYSTRPTYHGTLTAGYFLVDRIAVEASISTPATTNNIPTGSIAGTPNLGDDEFVMATLGASVHPIKGPISPYVGGGIIAAFTTQQRDGLAVGLNVPNAHGPYVQAGVDFALSQRFGLFFDIRKAFYHTDATGRLPLDPAFTTFANVDAAAKLDPLTIQLGLTAHFGPGTSQASPAIETDTTKWTIRAGVTSLRLADRLKLSVGGAPYPGAGASTFEHWTPTVQIGRFLTPNIAVSATVGFPPTIDVYGAGSIGALPKLGKITYGPTVLTLQYHPTRSGRIRPYIGAGAAYMIVFGTKDGAFKNLKVDNDLAPAFEAGTDFMVSQRLAIFADIKKAFLRPKAHGSFSGFPVESQTRLDPLAFSGGVAFHF